MGGDGSTAQVTPAKLTQFLAEEAQKTGTTLRLQTKATGVEVGGDGKVEGVRVVSQGKEQYIPATDVVFAAGYVPSKSVANSQSLDR